MGLAWGGGGGGLKVPKVRFLGFWQKCYPFRCAFLLQHKVPIYIYIFVLFAKATCLQKSGS